MIKRFSWSFQITLLAPFVTGGILGDDAGVDSPLLRNGQGRLILSGHQISGYFRHFTLMVKAREKEEGIKESASLVPWDTFFDWFGVPGKQLRNPVEQSSEVLELAGRRPPDINAEMGRGRLTFRDLAMEDDTGEIRHISRIRIDKQRQSVAHGAWQVIEQFHAQDKEVLFGSKGDALIVLYGDDNSKEIFTKAFDVFLEWLQALGGNKAQGFGREKCCLVEENVPIPVVMPVKNDLFDGIYVLEINITLDHSLLVDPQLLSGNLYRSSPHIPGGTLKAAIAEMAQASGCNWSDYSDILSDLVITHAQPNESTHAQPNESGVVPFSAVYDEDADCIGDWFTTDIGPQSLTFQSDLKPNIREHLKQLFNVTQPEYLTRTRTAITENTNRAKEHQLFNYQSVNPAQIVWKSTIRIPEGFSDNERSKASQLVSFLKSGLVQIGKLRADLRAEIRSAKSDPAEVSRVMLGDEERAAYRIKLVSPAWLLGISELGDLENGTPLRDVYLEIFKKLLPGKEINWDNFDFLAQHQWSGGRRAYRYKQLDDEGYHPYLLTQPGSVFVFPLEPNSNEEERINLESAFSSLLHTGLPQANPDADWQNCPFLPQNGFGQITVNDRDREAVA